MKFIIQRRLSCSQIRGADSGTKVVLVATVYYWPMTRQKILLGKGGKEGLQTSKEVMRKGRIRARDSR
eukprot:scaffold2436_cov80-Skeletonema_dohrnii-CCMP3373.AAC.14